MAQAAENTLRKFKDADDLLDHVDNEVIVQWINEYASMKPRFDKLQAAEDKRAGYHKVYQEKKKITLKLLESHLDPDEIKRIKELAEERIAIKEEEQL